MAVQVEYKQGWRTFRYNVVVGEEALYKWWMDVVRDVDVVGIRMGGYQIWRCCDGKWSLPIQVK